MKRVKRIRKLFETFPGWRTHDDHFDPCELLCKIAEVVGEPLNVAISATPAVEEERAR